MNTVRTGFAQANAQSLVDVRALLLNCEAKTLIGLNNSRTSSKSVS
jgi:hypothetical protein